MALPNDKISTSLVGTTLGVATRDVGQLCTHQAINKWSKCKPVRYPTTSGLTDWISINNNYGILFDEKTPPAHSYDAQYQRPEGGALDSPYRLGDFRGYNHMAQPKMVVKDIPASINKFSEIMFTSDFENNDTNVEIDLFTINITPNTPIEYEDGSLLGLVGELKIGCEFVQGNDVKHTIYSDKTISDTDGMKVMFDLLNIDAGIYDLRFFLYPLELHDRRFPFPATPQNPNIVALNILYDNPLVLTMPRYMYDTNGINTTFDDKPNINTFNININSISLRVLITTTEDISFDADSYQLSFDSNEVFEQGDSSYAIVTLSGGATNNNGELFIPVGGSALVTFERTIVPLIEYPISDPFNIDIELKERGILSLSNSFTMQFQQ